MLIRSQVIAKQCSFSCFILPVHLCAESCSRLLYKESVKATVTLTHNDTGASPISDVTYTASDGNDAVIIFNNDEGTALDVDTPLDIYACFAPTLSGSLTLVSTYDVYDSQGNLIRQDCTANNKLPDLEAVRAQRVQVNMTVAPSYLYVLSNPDLLNNPTVKIDN